MRDPFVVLAASCGASIAVGLLLVVLSRRTPPVRLDDAMALLAGEPLAAPATDQRLRAHDDDLPSRLGHWVFVHGHVPVSATQRRILALQSRSFGDFVAEKVILATVGLALPVMVTAVAAGLDRLVTPVPVLVTLVLAAVGWFLPDLTLSRHDTSTRADSGEALFTYLDLVTLERLANASASQALSSAASLSDVPLFLRIRSALDRARLEQRPPWSDLRRLAKELQLPQLADVADVMRLDEQGAALADTLRARVRELRDAHLLEEKLAAQAVSERMTFWMVIPSLLFALVFLGAPLLKLVGINP